MPATTDILTLLRQIVATVWGKIWISIITTTLLSVLTRAGKDFWSWIADHLWLHIFSIKGTWEATFRDGSIAYEETFTFKQYGTRIRGTFEYRDLPPASGPASKRTYEFEGLIKGQVVTARYWGKKEGPAAPLGSGCFLFFVVSEKKMDGGCAYFDFDLPKKSRFDGYTLNKVR
jgi:hypothetical protein